MNEKFGLFCNPKLHFFLDIANVILYY